MNTENLEKIPLNNFPFDTKLFLSDLQKKDFLLLFKHYVKKHIPEFKTIKYRCFIIGNIFNLILSTILYIAFDINWVKWFLIIFIIVCVYALLCVATHSTLYFALYWEDIDTLKKKGYYIHSLQFTEEKIIIERYKNFEPVISTYNYQDINTLDISFYGIIIKDFEIIYVPDCVFPNYKNYKLFCDWYRRKNLCKK